MATGGDVLDITCKHPLGDGVFFAKANEDSMYDFGGFRSDDDANMVDGSGQMIDKINQTRWAFEATISHDANTKQELAKLALYARSPVQGVWTISHVNGTVYTGTGKPVGDLSANGNAATIALKLAGGGSLAKISG